MGRSSRTWYRLISLPGHTPSPPAGGPIATAAAAPTAPHSPPRTVILDHPAGRFPATGSTQDVAELLVLMGAGDLQIKYLQGWGAGVSDRTINQWVGKFTRAVLVPTWNWARKSCNPRPAAPQTSNGKSRQCEGSRLRERAGGGLPLARDSGLLRRRASHARSPHVPCL